MKLSTTALLFVLAAMCSHQEASALSLGIKVYSPEQLTLRKIPSMMPQVNIHLQVMPIDVDESVAFGRTVADYSQSAVMVDGTLAFGRTYDSISALGVANIGTIPFQAAAKVDESVAFGRRVRDYSQSALYMDARLAFGRTYDSMGASPIALSSSADHKMEVSPKQVVAADSRIPLRAARAGDLQRVLPIASLEPWMPADETAQEIAARDLQGAFEDLQELFDGYAKVQVMAGQELVQPVEKNTY